MNDTEGQRLYSRLVTIMQLLEEIQLLEVDMKDSVKQSDTAKAIHSAVTGASSRIDHKVKPIEREVAIRKINPTVDVFVHAEILKMGEIDTKGQKFACNLRINSRWLAPELNGKQNDLKYKTFVEERDWKHWTPESFILNGGTGVSEAIRYQVLFDRLGAAMVEEVRTVNGTFAEKLELYDYPFDKQDLTVVLASAKSVTEVVYHQDPVLASAVRVSTFVHRQEWKLFDKIKLEEDTYRDTKTPGKPTKSLISIRCKAKRHSTFFFWNVIVLMICISGLSFSTFAIDFSSVPNRLPLTFLMMLSNTTFKFAVSKAIPKVCYLTYLDKYVLTSLTLMVLLCMWHASVASILKMSKDIKFTNRVDYGVMAAFCLAYVLFFAIFIAKTKYTVAKAMKRKEKQEKLRERQEEIVHQEK